MPDRSIAGGRAPVAGILATVVAILLLSVFAGPALAQSPSPDASPTAAVTVPPVTPAGTQPDTATGGSDPRVTGNSDMSPLTFLLLGIGAVAAVLVYLGMRGSQLRREPVGSDRDPPA